MKKIPSHVLFYWTVPVSVSDIHCYNLAVKNKMFFHRFSLTTTILFDWTQKTHFKPSAPDYEKPAAESEQQFNSWILHTVERKKLLSAL